MQQNNNGFTWNLAGLSTYNCAEYSSATTCTPSASGTTCLLDVTGDVFVYNSGNQNHYDFLIVGIHPGYPLKRTLLKFEDIPSSCHAIETANAYVYYWYAHKASFLSEEQAPFIPRPIQARQVLKSWTETRATRDVRFSNAPWSKAYLGLDNTDAKSHVDDTQTVSRNTSADYIGWNVTTTANNWLTGQPNHGILLSVSNEDQLGREIRSVP